MGKNILTVSNLSWVPQGGAGGLRDVNLALAPGEFLLVAGPSGGGKTTLLRLLVGLEEASCGTILFDDCDIARMAPESLRRHMALLPQTPSVVPGDVRKNLLLPFTFKANRDLAPPDDAALSAMLGEFLLEDVALADQAAALSVGQRQRLCLIRSLMLKPRVLLLDEPVSALDARSKEAVEAAAQRLCLERGVGVILVSHAGFVPSGVRPRRVVVADHTLREEA